MTTRLYYSGRRSARLRRGRAGLRGGRREVRRQAGPHGVLSHIRWTAVRHRSMGRVAVVDVVDGDEGEVLHVTTGRIEAGAHVRRRDRLAAPGRPHAAAHRPARALACVRPLWGARHGELPPRARSCPRSISRASSSPSEIDAAETAANAIVWDDRPVHVRFVSAEEAARLPLRKPSERARRRFGSWNRRISTCRPAAAPHVRTTGAVGVIAVAGWERFKGGTRVASCAAGGRLRLTAGFATGRGGRAPAVGGGRRSCRADRAAATGVCGGRTRLRSALQGEMAQYRAAEWRA